ncbi:MAG TPA: CCA tRNA nucleotidyltransferase [Candidatus Limnocylindria bacterium]
MDRPADAERLALGTLPDSVVEVLTRLRDAGHEAVLVGGTVRDAILRSEGWAADDVAPGDWDAATSADPETVAGLFPGSSWENRFGTVTVLGEPAVEITSFRAEGAYRDARRPDDVRFGVSLDEDLGRRDFTINALAWEPVDLDSGLGRLVDPHGGRRDLRNRVLRAVGDPRRRFAEDALRLVRAARFAGRLDLTIEPATESAISELASTVASISGERLRDELGRMLAHPRPSTALRLLEQLGLLAVVLPEVAALRGVAQAKRVPGDALDHTLAAVDAAPAEPPMARVAALLHDVGKATTAADGHFLGHDRVGAVLARTVLERLRFPRHDVEAVVGAVAHHMYGYETAWSDAAVRRFIRRIDGTDRSLLFALRRADDAASGAADEGRHVQDELEARVEREIAAQPALLLQRRVAVDGNDLQRDLGIPPGPELGRILEALVDFATDDPSRNVRATLLAHAAALMRQAVPGRTGDVDRPAPEG